MIYDQEDPMCVNRRGIFSPRRDQYFGADMTVRRCLVINEGSEA